MLKITTTGMSKEHKEWFKGRVLSTVENYKMNKDTTNSGWDLIRYTQSGFIIADDEIIPDNETLKKVNTVLEDIFVRNSSMACYELLRFGKIGYVKVDLERF